MTQYKIYCKALGSNRFLPVYLCPKKTTQKLVYDTVPSERSAKRILAELQEQFPDSVFELRPVRTQENTKALSILNALEDEVQTQAAIWPIDPQDIAHISSLFADLRTILEKGLED